MSAENIRNLAARSAVAARAMLDLTPRRKRTLLMSIADELEKRRGEILAANAADYADARERGRSKSCLERLEMTSTRFAALVHAFRTIADMTDPIGEPISRWIRPNGLEIVRVRVPIGVVGVVFESRPHIVGYAAALCLKVGNALLMVGDSDGRRTGEALAEAIQAGGLGKGFPPDALLTTFSDNPAVCREVARMQGLVDVLIPRGTRAFVDDLVDHARIPVLKHLGGACHIYVDATARTDIALDVIRDCRCNEPYSCNAADTVLIHRSLAPGFIREMFTKGFCGEVNLQLDDEIRAQLPDEILARAEDSATDLQVTIAVVDGIEAAVDKINQFGSHVSDAIISEDNQVIDRFMCAVDSACVVANASPRFADGGEFGMGAEIGFSTDKLHARGPLGFEELTSTKYRVTGKGQVRG